jgi:hypothetical protein
MVAVGVGCSPGRAVSLDSMSAVRHEWAAKAHVSYNNRATGT